jgi:SAM-dependent methyltransferase
MTGNRAWADHPDLVAFYADHRRRPSDLYPSERRFLPWLASRADSVLDAGCAAGGFSEIWRHFAPELQYTGVDVSPALVETARRLHPEHEFVQGNVAAGLPLPDHTAMVVQALGWLFWEPEYEAALEELWRLTGRWLFVDFRTVESDDLTIGRQQIALVEEWDEVTTVPYLAVPWADLAELLLRLRPARILGYGYLGPPAETVVGIPGEVCFAVFVLERAEGSAEARPTVCIDLPFAWPSALADQATVLPAADLATLVPEEAL